MKLSYSTLVSLLKNYGLYLPSIPSNKIECQKNPDTCFGHFTTQLSEVRDHSIFIAYKGIHFDSHRNMTKALEQGAALVIFDDPFYIDPLQERGLHVSSSRQAWSLLCAFTHGHPEKKLNFIGVTGTNGKTSTTWFISKMLNKIYQEKVLLIGTLGAFLHDTKIETQHTTPDPDQLFSLFERALQAGITTVVMEVSSQSILHKRIFPLKFKTCIFTSFSRDHLDLHQTMEKYWQTKIELFTNYMREDGHVIIHKNIQTTGNFPSLKNKELIIYEDVSVDTSEKENDENIEPSLVKFSQKIDRAELSSILTVKNALSIWQGAVSFFDMITSSNFVAALLAIATIKKSIPNSEEWHNIPVPPGRMETYFIKRLKILIIVDYAHTPDGLEKILLELKKITLGNIWTVFGCGGDRDPGKRSLMGQTANKHSSHVIVTTDNPRNEDPKKIILDITKDLLTHKKIIIKTDRREAIEYAIRNAQQNDAVLIAGKGAEPFQLIGKEKIPFDDREVVKKILTGI